MSLADLARIAPPPAIGSHPDWPEVERRIGTALPRDYKAIVEAVAARLGGGKARWRDPAALTILNPAPFAMSAAYRHEDLTMARVLT